MGWEVASSASSHSALAGVLAGVVLILVPLLLERQKDAHRREDVVRLLIQALILLITAAVVFGALAGEPTSADLADDLPSDVAMAQAARNLILGTVAVVMLASGALAMLAGLLEGVGDLATTGHADRYFTGASVILAALAVNQVAVLYMLAVEAHSLATGATILAKLNPDFGSLILTLLFGLLASGIVIFTRRRPQRAPSSTALIRAATRAVGVSALCALLAYVFIPIGQPLAPPDAAVPGDAVALSLSGASILAFLFYAITVTWYVALPVERLRKKSST